MHWCFVRDVMHSKEDLNCYFFRIIFSNNLNSDNVKTKLQPGVFVCKQWHQRKRGEKMMTTSELIERKKLKNNAEKTEREKTISTR